MSEEPGNKRRKTDEKIRGRGFSSILTPYGSRSATAAGEEEAASVANREGVRRKTQGSLPTKRMQFGVRLGDGSGSSSIFGGHRAERARADRAVDAVTTLAIDNRETSAASTSSTPARQGSRNQALTMAGRHSMATSGNANATALTRHTRLPGDDRTPMYPRLSPPKIFNNQATPMLRASVESLMKQHPRAPSETDRITFPMEKSFTRGLDANGKPISSHFRLDQAPQTNTRLVREYYLVREYETRIEQPTKRHRKTDASDDVDDDHRMGQQRRGSPPPHHQDEADSDDTEDDDDDDDRPAAGGTQLLGGADDATLFADPASHLVERLDGYREHLRFRATIDRQEFLDPPRRIHPFIVPPMPTATGVAHTLEDTIQDADLVERQAKEMEEETERKRRTKSNFTVDDQMDGEDEDDEKKKLPLAALFKLPPGVFTCTECRAPSLPNATECVACKAWKCHNCSKINIKDSTSCQDCGAPKPDNLTTGAPGRATEAAPTNIVAGASASSGISFGSSSAAPNASFTFGSGAAPASTGGFQFGAVNDSASATGIPTGGFRFGAPAAAASGATPPTSFTFGNSLAAQSSTAAAAPNGFTFNPAPVSTPSESTTAASSFSFGAAANQSSSTAGSSGAASFSGGFSFNNEAPAASSSAAPMNGFSVAPASSVSTGAPIPFVAGAASAPAFSFGSGDSETNISPATASTQGASQTVTSNGFASVPSVGPDASHGITEVVNGNDNASTATDEGASAPPAPVPFAFGADNNASVPAFGGFAAVGSTTNDEGSRKKRKDGDQTNESISSSNAWGSSMSTVSSTGPGVFTFGQSNQETAGAPSTTQSFMFGEAVSTETASQSNASAFGMFSTTGGNEQSGTFASNSYNAAPVPGATSNFAFSQPPAAFNGFASGAPSAPAPSPAEFGSATSSFVPPAPFSAAPAPGGFAQAAPAPYAEGANVGMFGSAPAPAHVAPGFGFSAPNQGIAPFHHLAANNNAGATTFGTAPGLGQHVFSGGTVLQQEAPQFGGNAANPNGGAAAPMFNFGAAPAPAPSSRRIVKAKRPGGVVRR
ncbi:hypothetical protein MPSEU_000726700 [Mayamaea pseudoterrestris]|nr:hypothetical protein MPSEU_000726700 [Mayamaea pseudoterrestris]